MRKNKSPLARHLSRAVLALIFSTPVVIFLASIQTTPLEVRGNSLSPSEVSSVQNLLVANAPSSAYDAAEQTIQLDENELNLLIRYGLNSSSRTQLWSGRAELRPGEIGILSTAAIKWSPIPLYFNIQGTLTQQNNRLRLSQLRIGLLELPSSAIDFLVGRVINGIDDSSVAIADLYALVDNIKSLEIAEDSAEMALIWDPHLMSQLTDQTRQLFVSNEDRKKVAHYYQFLSQIAETMPLDIKAVSLNAYLAPLFSETQIQSANTQDYISENRAAFQALGAFVNEEDIAQLIGQDMAKGMSRTNQVEIRVHRRQDLAKHLTTIASITSSAGADFAAMVSTTKEAYDARYRSGFSFSDLAANTVGVQLASLGTSSQNSAARLQVRLAHVTDEAEYMPLIGSNRDGLSETDFNDLYSDRNSDEYMLRLNEIEDLVNSAPVFKDLQ